MISHTARPPSALGPLDAANQVFSKAYESTREHAGKDVPILVLLPFEVVVHCEGQRSAFRVFRASFSAAKNVAHIAVALFSLTMKDGPLSAESMTRAKALRAHATSALEQLDDPALEAIRPGLASLLELSVQFCSKVLERHLATAEERAAFASRAGAQILSITELATSAQIAELHEAVEAALGPLAEEQRARLQIVVVGDHQARSRSLGMQYFQRRLREHPGDDERVTYGEHITEEKDALALVGTRQLDRYIASAFFGDEKRLQRDVLGDAAKTCLESLDLPHL